MPVQANTKPASRKRNVFYLGIAAVCVVILALVLFPAVTQDVLSGQTKTTESGDLIITRGGGNSACARTTTLRIHEDGSGFTHADTASGSFCPSSGEKTFPKGTFDRAALDEALQKIGSVDKIPELSYLKFNPTSPDGVTEVGCAPSGDVGFITVSYQGHTSPDLGCYGGDAGATNVNHDADAFVQLVLKADKQ